jgi:hypothetical protein
MSTFRPEQLQQPLNITGSLFGTASYATFAANATPFPYTGTAVITGSLVVTGSLIVNGVKQLTQTITQTSTTAPVATTLTNTTGLNFTWQHYNVGWYRLTSSSPIFTTNRTFVTITPGFDVAIVDSPNSYIIWYALRDTSTIDIYTKQIGGTLVDDILYQTGFDVKIYP